MKLPDDFVKFYNELKVAHPPLNSFLGLDFRFTIGVYMDYFTSKGITVDVSTIGYLIRKYPTTSRENNILSEAVFDKEYDIIIAFSKAIQGTFAYLENPF